MPDLTLEYMVPFFDSSKIGIAVEDFHDEFLCHCRNVARFYDVIAGTS